jgi:predicted PurR-regulated permease PerM
LTLSLASVMGLIHLVVYLVLVPFMVFFLLKDKEMILEWGRRFLPDNMDLTESVWQEANIQVTNYIRGKGWELLIIWGISYAVVQGHGTSVFPVDFTFCGTVRHHSLYRRNGHGVCHGPGCLYPVGVEQ